MPFGDLNSSGGLNVLNAYLANKSYIEGFQPSQADAVVFSKISGAPSKQLNHALRWWNHIKSFGKDVNCFPGVPKAVEEYGPPPQKAQAKATADDDDDEDDVDLFGSDDDVSEEAEQLKAARLKQYEERKSKKAPVIAKSNIILDVKPWDDETDMAQLEKVVREISSDGLIWGASKLVPIAYGVKKLQISCVVEDDKVGLDFLEEAITNNEDFVQSVDVAAFNKI